MNNMVFRTGSDQSQVIIFRTRPIREIVTFHTIVKDNLSVQKQNHKVIKSRGSDLNQDLSKSGAKKGSNITLHLLL